MAPLSPRPLPSPDAGLRLAVPARSQRDAGTLVTTVEAQTLIAGAELAAGRLWPDDRGFFAELFRLPADHQATQVSAAVSFTGVIKAFHYHRLQTDCWTPLRGQFRLALANLRCDSPTFDAVNTLFAGEWQPWRIIIPPGIAHGCKVVGPEPGVMVYATDRFYNPDDEGRIPYDDPGIQYAWETQFR